MKEYYQRVSDKVLLEHLESKGAVLIEGAKWCGKTTSAKHIAKSVIEMDRPDMTEQYQQMARIKPSNLLEGKVPHLIDEWQIATNIWNAVRYEVDRRGEFGQFILTGSSVPAALDESMHTGTGRIVRMQMRPMSLFESKDSTGQVSLMDLFNKKDISTVDNHSIDEIAFLICRGGWPAALNHGKKVALKQAFDYYDAVVNDDISRVDRVKRDSERTKRILKSYARNVATQASLETIRSDVISNDVETFDKEALYGYLNALKRIFVIEDSPAWNPNLRSKTAIRTSDTRYFVDPSIAVAALGLGPTDLVNNLELMGLIFENLCVRDLRIYADALDGSVYHYRDKTGLECDAVIHLRNGSYGLVEVKLGGNQSINEGAESLLKLTSKIDTEKMKKPAFLMVLCGVAPFAYKREDGVFVVPITCLKD
ncbi:ATP-binding protein [Treponema sp.]|uniref:ATP-binding protein n=1 Tax=Treponema sp. TaxID=166 RepID=UPI003FA1E5E7